MKSMDKEKVYFKMEKKKAIEINKDILVKDIGEVYCSNDWIKEKVENIRVKEKSDIENWDCITAIEVAEKVIEKASNIDLDMIGEPEILIEYKSQERENKVYETIKVILVCIVLFFGASIAIINFHEDVDSRASLQGIYETFTGGKSKNPLIMAIPYSIGLGVGVIAFFTRILSSSKRRAKEPGPMEIELYLYDQDMEEHVINEVKKNKKE